MPDDQHPTPALVLWATPRTVSTAFERMMIERGDHLVLDEPWSRSYYFGPQRRSDRYPLVFAESTESAVAAGVLAAAAAGPVFVKDMAYHAAHAITDDTLAAMRHTFLIRDPSAAITSLAHRWPDFTDEEAGYDAQRALFDRIVDVTGDAPIVIDSDTLRADPERIVAAWCEQVGLEHRPASLRWEAGMRPEWQLWRDWYSNVAASTGFHASRPSRAAADLSPPAAARVAGLVAAAIEAVAPLREHALR